MVSTVREPLLWSCPPDHLANDLFGVASFEGEEATSPGRRQEHAAAVRWQVIPPIQASGFERFAVVSKIK